VFFFFKDCPLIHSFQVIVSWLNSSSVVCPKLNFNFIKNYPLIYSFQIIVSRLNISSVILQVQYVWHLILI
jgi:hypothetical protein